MTKKILYEVYAPKNITEMTAREFENALTTADIAVLSFGAIENHANHLPLGTDNFQGEAMMKRTAAMLTEDGLPAIPAFCVPFGVQTNLFERDYVMGNVFLSQDTFIRMVSELVLSLADNGFKRFVFCVSHAEDFAALNVIAKDLGDKHHIPIIVVDWITAKWKIVSAQGRGMNNQGHAGEGETSNILAIAPNLVDLSADVEAYYEPEDQHVVLDDGLFYYGGSVGIYTPVKEDHSPGYGGEPAKATAENGDYYLDVCARWMADVVLKYWG